MGGFTETSPGLETESVSIDEFRQFAARFGRSDEIGPIGTYYDSGQSKRTATRVRLLGLRACHTLIAVACFTLNRSKDGQSHSCKLDSVIVTPTLRKLGLAGLLVAQGFRELVEDDAESVTSIYAHSVHPATVKLLRKHGFSDPQLAGAPISALRITDEGRNAFLTSLKVREQATSVRLRHKCVACVNRKKGAVPWCTLARH